MELAPAHRLESRYLLSNPPLRKCWPPGPWTSPMHRTQSRPAIAIAQAYHPAHVDQTRRRLRCPAKRNELPPVHIPAHRADF